MAWLSCILNDCCKPKKTAYHTQLMHLWWLLLPVPPQQLFPSGGSYYLHNYKGPSFLVALFFCPLAHHTLVTCISPLFDTYIGKIRYIEILWTETKS